MSGGTAVQWGPTYVAGNTTLSGSGQWNVSLLVTAGNLTISGTRPSAATVSARTARPATILLTGQGKAMTYSSRGTYYGLLCNTLRGFQPERHRHHQGLGALRRVLLALANSASIAYDPNVGSGSRSTSPPPRPPRR